MKSCSFEKKKHLFKVFSQVRDSPEWWSSAMLQVSDCFFLVRPAFSCLIIVIDIKMFVLSLVLLFLCCLYLFSTSCRGGFARRLHGSSRRTWICDSQPPKMGVDTFGDPAKKAEEVGDFNWFSQYIESPELRLRPGSATVKHKTAIHANHPFTRWTVAVK